MFKPKFSKKDAFIIYGLVALARQLGIKPDELRKKIYQDAWENTKYLSEMAEGIKNERK